MYAKYLDDAFVPGAATEVEDANGNIGSVIYRTPAQERKIAETKRLDAMIVYGGVPYTRAALEAKLADAKNKAENLENEFARAVWAKDVVKLTALLGA